MNSEDSLWLQMRTTERLLDWLDELFNLELEDISGDGDYISRLTGKGPVRWLVERDECLAYLIVGSEVTDLILRKCKQFEKMKETLLSELEYVKTR